MSIISDIVFHCKCQRNSYLFHACDELLSNPVRLEEMCTVYILYYLNRVAYKHSLHTIGGATFDTLWALSSLPLPETLKRLIVSHLDFIVKPNDKHTFIRQEVRWNFAAHRNSISRYLLLKRPLLVFTADITLSLNDIKNIIGITRYSKYNNVIFLDIDGIKYKGKELFTNYLALNCNSQSVKENASPSRWPDYIETTNEVPFIQANNLLSLYDYFVIRFFDFATENFLSKNTQKLALH